MTHAMTVSTTDDLACSAAGTAGLRGLAVILTGLALLIASPGQAQQCGLDTRVPFAGHSLPLEGDIEIPILETPPAFPDWRGADLEQPLYMTHSPDGTDRLFIVERAGRIRVIPNDPAVTSASLGTFLDIRSRIDDDFVEEGLLGLAFHPDYASNRYFYVHQTSQPSECEVYTRCAQVVRYRANNGDPDTSNPNSKFVVLEIDRPGQAENHNGGMLAFGEDGYLYISVGDQNLGTLSQDTTSLRGKILRIDVDSGSELDPGIPSDNPFGNAVWHYGLRNPWRFSFDRGAAGDLWIGDVGAANREEVTWIRPGEGSGLDLGWPGCEGTRPTSGGSCDPNHRFPDIEYSHSTNNRNGVTGGYVYRGAIASLRGKYIFGDLNGELLVWDRVTRDPQTDLAIFESFSQPSNTIASFGEDEQGEVYFWNYPQGGGGLRHFSVAGTTPGGGFPEFLSQTGFFSDTANLVPAPGMIEYEVESPLWSDGAAKLRWVALPGTEKIHFSSFGNWEFPVATAFVKHFALEQSGEPRRVETRVMLRQNDRWLGLTYRWNEEQTDALLMEAGFEEDIALAGGGSQTWIYPSPADCLDCHSEPTGRVLGVRTRQINTDFDYRRVTDNQLHAWNCIDLFDTNVGDPASFPAHANLEDTSATVGRRARSYLESNCSSCHRPGTANANIDLLSDTLLGDMELIGEPPSRGDLGLPSPLLVEPGDADNSVLWLRSDSTDESIRMAKGTLLRDAPAVTLLRSWIEGTLWDSGGATAFLDSDEDGAEDSGDNCPSVDNASQLDSDDDGLGDVCDPDQQPDLRPTANGPSQASPGETVSVGALVTNLGSLTAPTSQVRVHLSRNATLGATDYLIAECFVGPIPGGQSANCTESSAVVPEEIANSPGTHFWIVCADGLELVAEGNEDNNCDSRNVMIQEATVDALQGHDFKLSATLLAQVESEKTGDLVIGKQKVTEKVLAANCLGQESLEKGQAVVVTLRDACADPNDNSIDVIRTDPFALEDSIGSLSFDLDFGIDTEKKGAPSALTAPVTVELACQGTVDVDLEARGVASVKLDSDGCVQSIKLQNAVGSGTFDLEEVILDKAKISVGKSDDSFVDSGSN